METIMEAVRLMESKKSNEAIALLEDYLPMADEEERFTIAELFIQWGFLQEASTILQELMQQYPQESEIKIMLADIYVELENDEEAINLLNDIKEDDESYLEALIQLADLYQAQGLFEVAEQKLLAAKQLNPTEPIIDFALGELLFSTGEYKKAITHYEKVIEVTSEIANVPIHTRLAECYAGIGEYEEALAIYQDVDNEDSDTLFKYGLTAYQAGRSDISIKAWEQVVEIDPYYHTVYYQLAKVYEEEEMPIDAYNAAKKGLQVDEFNKELFFYAGSLAHQVNEDEESEKWIREAIALDPDYKEAILFLVEFFKAKENHSAIVELLEQIKKSGADDPLYEWELARAYEKTESYNDALNHYQEAYNNLNQDSEFLKEYAYFLTEEGRIAEALPIFKTYLTQQPEDYEVEEFFHRLNQ
ncbi:tetratricopeptide repeat protein [Lentibacillus sp. Marseille-P4043]|uniref:tetratricopeptide repeat protein n=1 Tax=Lentibacillus sp. Marseille-P4043 TaxID=2040293 RepID=UPI000D0AE75E|nr:tetratricopeptide repeat protein [Lentibacillus sp. Marseille-P4043]